SMESMRCNFGAMQRDLTASMNLCKKSFDQSNRVMFTITELLYKAIEIVQHKRPFKSSTLIYATFEMMDACETPKTAQDIVLLKFAKSFTLFIDSLHGYGLYPKPNEVRRLYWVERKRNILSIPDLRKLLSRRPPKRAR
ncbi:hypothetical protein PENTCL1PPCAC_29707, partial [Pristionchus entomophagus]